MKEEPPKKPCDGSACGAVVTERNRYFTGKYMTARDFQGEQQYFLSRHHLHNRLLHGWGIVCGLSVVRHPNADCAARWLVVKAGIAIDCCGRELILSSDTPFELPLPKEDDEAEAKTVVVAVAPKDAAPSKADPKQRAAKRDDDEEEEEKGKEYPHPGHPPERTQWLLCVRYVEEEIECVPVLYNEGFCDAGRKEANRIRETVRIEVVPLEDVGAGCWKSTDTGMDAPCRDDCDDQVPGPAGICLEPECPCGHRVPLALITFDPDHPDAGFEIDLEGRRTMVVPPEFHTHIVGINWPHGGRVSLAHLRKEMKGRLEIRFDRKIQAVQEDATGINPFTFIVEFGGVYRDVKYLPYAPKRPPTLEDECLAVFHINSEYVDPEAANNVADNWVYIRLRCDFILDCHGNPVDGEHLRGRVPTGDGTPGGDFVSWFYVEEDTDDHHHHHDHEHEHEHEPEQTDYPDRDKDRDRDRERREPRSPRRAI